MTNTNTVTNTPAFTRAHEGRRCRADMVAAGHDTQHGANGTYHLCGDFAGFVARQCENLVSGDHPRAEVKHAVNKLAWLLGYRWVRGVQNLRVALEGAGYGEPELATYDVSREATWQRICRHLDAASRHLEASEISQAVDATVEALSAAHDELADLAPLLEEVNPHEAESIRNFSHKAGRALVEFHLWRLMEVG